MAKIIDLKNEQFHEITVLSLSHMTKRGAVWSCSCSCGELLTVSGGNLKSGNTKRCLKCSYKNKRLSLTGMQFGYLKVLSIHSINKNKNTVWDCLCVCGSKGQYIGIELNRGNTSSCGCKTNNIISESLQKPHRLQIYKSAYTTHLDNASRRKLKSTLSFAEYISIAEKPCIYCGVISERKTRKRDLVRRSIQLNSVDRKNNEPHYNIENSVPCCFRCQEMKMSATFDDFKKEIERIYNHLCLMA